MKHLTKIILLLLLSPSVCFGALATGTLWEFRAANGSATNGGGFNPDNASVGTDRTFQNNAQDSGTDLASADGDAVPCVVTSATHNFVADDNGNLIQITETGNGFTLGFYEIVSTATNAATLDRACGTDGAKTGGDWAYGGALDILTDNLIDSVFIAGNKAHIKNDGTMTLTGAIVGTSDGSATNPKQILGYNTARNDNPTGTDRPLIAAGSNQFAVDNFWMIRNIRVTTTHATGLRIDDGGMIINVYSQNTGSGRGLTLEGGGGSKIIHCEAESSTGVAVRIDADCVVYGSYIHDSDFGIATSNSGYAIINNIIDTHTTCLNISNDVGIIANNTVYGCTTGLNGIANERIAVLNNIFDTHTTGVTWSSEQFSNHFDYNNYNGASVSNITKGDNAVDDDCLMTAPGDGDFTLQSESPCLDAGMQVGVNQGATGDYKWNIGVDQDDVSAGGGSVTVGYGYTN